MDSQFSIAYFSAEMFEDGLEGDFGVAFEGFDHFCFLIGGVETPGIKFFAAQDSLREVPLNGGFRQISYSGNFAH